MTILQILSLLFATAAVFGLITCRWLKLPITIGTMLLTMLASLALILTSKKVPGIHLWVTTFLNQIDFGTLILRGMLPLLLFAGAFLLDLDELVREKLAITLLSTVGTGIMFFLVALLMELMSSGRIPWIECLIFGALISPTDPIAVLEMLRRVGIPKHIEAQLAGESLFNDGIGAVLFITMLDVAAGNAPTPGTSLEFCWPKPAAEFSSAWWPPELHPNSCAASTRIRSTFWSRLHWHSADMPWPTC